MSLQIGIPLFIAAGLLQSTLLARLRVFGGQPDLIVLMVLAWATLDRKGEGLAWAFAGGLVLDLLSGAPLGISSLALLPAAYAMAFSEARGYRSTTLLPLAFMAAGALLYHLLYVGALRVFAGYPVAWVENLRYVTLPSVLFDVVLAVPVLRVLGRWYDRLHRTAIKL